jgi:hypothetical protein
MENVFTSELLKMLGILGLGGFSLMAMLSRVVGKIRGSFQPYIKPAVIYLLVTALIFAVLGFIGYAAFFTNPLRSFITLQLIFVLLGTAHIYYMEKYLLFTTGPKSIGITILFSFIVCLFGYMFFVVVFKWINRLGYHYMAGAAAIFFIIPYFVYQAFLKAIAMPPKVFTEWFYPVHVGMQEPDDSKLKNMLVISFEFQKKMNEPHFTNFRAKAPRDMEFGQLFYYFINDYNERHPNGKIEFADKNLTPYGWIFYQKPSWYTVTTKYIDTDKTFYANRIRENEVIVCRRSLNM